MKSQTTGMLILSFVAATMSSAAAQDAQQSPNTIVVGAGNDLRCRLEKGLRITKPGEPITARLMEPIYVGTILAIPAGVTVTGHVSSISTVPLSTRTGRLLSGDFTPPQTARVTFDSLILTNGASVPIHTDTIAGVADMRTALYVAKSQRPGLSQKIKDATKPLHDSNKLERLKEAAITSLPYHPQYLNQGTVFETTLLDPVIQPVPTEVLQHTTQGSGENYLHLRLLTSLKSDAISRGTPIVAAVSQPYYSSTGLLLYPAGTKLEGTVNTVKAADWMKKNGGLLFSFHSSQNVDGTASDVKGIVAGVEATGEQRLTVGQEGGLKATTSLFSRLRAPLSLVGPSRALADPTTNKTAWSRAGEGNRGFGLLGAGAAQASAATAIGFGYFGGAMRIYNAFFAKGVNVELPVNTPILLRMNEQLSNVRSNGHYNLPLLASLTKP